MNYYYVNYDYPDYERIELELVEPYTQKITTTKLKKQSLGVYKSGLHHFIYLCYERIKAAWEQDFKVPYPDERFFNDLYTLPLSVYHFIVDPIRAIDPSNRISTDNIFLQQSQKFYQYLEDIRNPIPKDKTTVELFAGAGGLALGLEEAGFNVVAANDMGSAQAATFKANFQSEFFFGPLAQQGPSIIKKYKRNVDLVSGGPSCQPFSRRGGIWDPIMERRLRGIEHPAYCIPDYNQTVAGLQSTAFTMENVQDLGQTKQWREEVLFPLIVYFENRNYYVSWKILSASDFGLPQKRNRLIIVGSKKGIFQFPKPNHGNFRRPEEPDYEGPIVSSLIPNRFGTPNTSSLNFQPHIEFKKISVNSFYSSSGLTKNSDIYPINPNGLCHTITTGVATHWFDMGNAGYKYWKNLVRFKTAERKRIVVHDEETDDIVYEYTGPRDKIYGFESKRGRIPKASCLSWEEARTIQGFPDDFIFVGDTQTKLFELIGNAVPPIFGKIIGTELLKQRLV